jgi:hypothetical protein
MVYPRFAMDQIHRNRIFRQLNEEHPRMAWIYVSTKVDTHQQQREIVGGGEGADGGGVSAMDGATELTGTYLQRPPPSVPSPPSHGMQAVAVAVEVAGQRPALPWVQGAALPNTPAYILLTND